MLLLKLYIVIIDYNIHNNDVLDQGYVKTNVDIYSIITCSDRYDKEYELEVESVLMDKLFDIRDLDGILKESSLKLSSDKTFKDVVASKLKECSKNPTSLFDLFTGTISFSSNKKCESGPDTLVKFNTIKSELMKLIKDYEIINTSYNNIVNNEDKIKIIREKKGELFILIENMKKLIKQSMEEDNDAFLKEGLEIYVNYIQPITKDLLNIKYANNSILVEEKEKDIFIYTIIQEPYTLKQLTYSIIGQDNKILINKK